MDSSHLLAALGLDYYSYVEPSEEPELVDVRFKDLIPSLARLGRGSIADRRLYQHQLEALEALRGGLHVVLRSGTGSGKTEAWLLYSLGSRKATLAVYPTLALANDQVRRIREYASTTELSVEVLDAARRRELVASMGSAKARARLTSMDVVVTNPALLLNEVKRMAQGKTPLLGGFLAKLELLVLDEIDFYGPRELALLLGLVRALRLLRGGGFQVAALTATLANPEDLAGFLEDELGRPSKVIEGRAFRVENRVYVVLGRNLGEVWKQLRSRLRPYLSQLGGDVKEALEDFEVFKRRIHAVLEASHALGIDPPSLDLDPADLLAHYVEDQWVTLVFTKSIAKAEELARRLRANLEGEAKRCVAAHHHLLSREDRSRAELGARLGEVKVLISPRTLSQGVDIGTVARVVHVGLPEDVREFYQREGRKGRRREIGFSETIILPSTSWDREVLSRGLDALKEWLSMPLERIVVNPSNDYLKLFEALLKFTSPKLRPQLSRDEYGFLQRLGLVKEGELTERGKEAWRNLNFYEYGPPFGVNRVAVDESGEERYLEGISHCDLVERFQIGCLDYTSDSIVVEHRLGGRTGRVVTAVVEEPLSPSTLRRREGLAEALEEYREVKAKWGEEGSIYSDYLHGRLHSEVLCAVYTPRRGFGRLLKVPNRVAWRVYASKPKAKRVGDQTIVYRDFKVIPVPVATHGKYTDYTYGAFYELAPDEDASLARLGLAFLMIVLRRLKGVAFETIMYDVGKLGERKYFTLHEPEAAGLINQLDWLEVKHLVEAYQPSRLDEVLMKSFDEYAYADLVSMGLDWDTVKQAAVKMVDYVLLESRIKLWFRGLELAIPRPSRALKLASLDALYTPLVEEARLGLVCLSLYDGEQAVEETLYRSFGSLRGEYRIDRWLARLVDEGFTILVYGGPQLQQTLSNAGLTSMALLLKALSEEGRLMDVEEEVVKTLSQPAPLDELSNSLVQRSVTLLDVAREVERSRRRVAEKPLGEWQRYTKYLSEALKKYLNENARSIYLLHLTLKQLRGEST